VIAALLAEGELWWWDRGGRWCVVLHGDDSGSLVDGQGVEKDLWRIEAEPAFGVFVRLEVGVSGFIVVRHGMVGLAMEGTVWLVTKVGVLQGMGACPCAVSSGARGEDCVVALVYKALIEEGGK